MGNWGSANHRAGYEYAFAEEGGKISAEVSQDIPIKLKDNALYTYIEIPTIHPVIRLQAHAELLPTKLLNTNSGTENMPYAYKSFRKLGDMINGEVPLGQITHEHWLTVDNQICKTKALNLYIGASRHVLSMIRTSLQNNAGINGNIVMQRGDVIAYPDDYNPWCLGYKKDFNQCVLESCEHGLDTNHTDYDICVAAANKCVSASEAETRERDETWANLKDTIEQMLMMVMALSTFLNLVSIFLKMAQPVELL